MNIGPDILWRRSAVGRAGVPMLLGAASALALPPLHVIPVLALTIPGLLFLIGRRRGAWGAAATGFWFGFGLHVVGLYWITEAILFEAARFWWLVPLAVPALSALLALFVAVPCGVARLASPGWRRVAALVGGWVLADLARQFVGTGFPWNPLGSVWAMPGRPGDVMLQLASLVGVHGMTLATLVLASCFGLGRRARLLACGALVLWAGFGIVRLQAAPPAAPGVRVVLVQGNIAQGQKWDRAFAIRTFQTYLDLTRTGVAQARLDWGGRIVVVWPETASPFLLAQDIDARAAIAEAAGPGIVVLAGSVRYDAAGRPRNSLMAITGPEAPAALYDKWHLVPFGEFAPSWLPLPIQVVPGGGFGFGPGPQTMVLPGLPPAGPIICYESIYSSAIVDEAMRPDWIVNVTNDAWFGNSTGPRQHLAAVRMRAVEEGLPLARAANTGISAAFDSLGRELGRRGMQVRGTLVVDLPGHVGLTFVSRYGLWIPGIAGVICLAFGFAELSRPVVRISKV